jgi:hypothetical protein
VRPARLETFARRQEALLGWKVEAKTLIKRLRRLREEFQTRLDGGKRRDGNTSRRPS